MLFNLVTNLSENNKDINTNSIAIATVTAILKTVGFIEGKTLLLTSALVVNDPAVIPRNNEIIINAFFNI